LIVSLIGVALVLRCKVAEPVILKPGHFTFR